MLRKCVLGILSAGLVPCMAGCAVGPDFKPTAAPIDAGYSQRPLPTHTNSSSAALGASQRFVTGHAVPAKWWQLFRSQNLNALVERALEANPNLQSQIAALRAAQDLTREQQGKFFPTVQANFTPSRTKSPDNPLLSSAPAGPDGIPINPFSVYTTQVVVSYTIDVWGQNRRAVESQAALAEAQHFQVEAAYNTLTASVVTSAVQQASLRGQIDATLKIIEAESKIVALVRQQLEAGYANRSDLAAQEAALAQVKATLPGLRQQLAVQSDILAALAGGFPNQLREAFKLSAFHLPTDLPLSLPSALIEQRPDVRAAEEQLHSATAQVGVAVANLLPNFTINGARGYSSLELASLISPPNIFWTIAGNATQTIFDGFMLINQARAAEGSMQQAAWAYRTTVIAAVQNVADALHALHNDADSLKAARDFERAAKISLDLATQQMEHGNANVLLLLTAQQSYLQAVIQVTQVEANRLADTAALYAALGGGWWNPGRPTVPIQTFDAAAGVAEPLTETQVNWFPWFKPLGRTN